LYKFVKNYDEILNSSLNDSVRFLRKLALDCLEIGISSVLPKEMIQKSITIDNDVLSIGQNRYDLRKYESIYIIGGGKASAEMVFIIEKMLKNVKDLSYKGMINVPIGTPYKNLNLSNKIIIYEANHPIPDEMGLIGTKNMIDLISKSTKNDLFIVLISGGGSALLTLPKKGISLEDLKQVNKLLLKSGASIQEINTIRKHVSDFKGGNLAKKIYETSNAHIICLIISDVIGNELDMIASGPTVPDSTSYKDAIEIIEKYELYDKFPNSIIEVIEVGKNDPKLENPKEGDPCFKNVLNFLIGSVEIAIEAITKYLKSSDFEVNKLKYSFQGEARNYGSFLAYYLLRKLDEDMLVKPIALIGSGELTVTITGKGIGGRNQEMLLALLNDLMNKKIKNQFLVLGVNLDGIEGNSKAMGALIDNQVYSDIIKNHLNLESYLVENDSNSFFQKVKTQIITGPTGVNVNDILLIFTQK
jgi:glycerate 2-kinase